MNGEELKRRCLACLEGRAMEHPSGHQGKLASRYVLRCGDGDVAELMFEKGPKTAANLWVAHRRVAELIGEAGLTFRHAPAAALLTMKGKNGTPIYGRHSALKPMRELRHADLICFRISTLGELDRILDHVEL